MAFEGPPGLTFRARREVETRVQSDPAERGYFETVLGRVPGVTKDTSTLIDHGFAVEGLHGRARIREVRPTGGGKPYFEWSVKKKVPESTTKYTKAPYEYQGTAESYDEAEARLIQFLEHFLKQAEPTLEQNNAYVHTRTTYCLPSGVVVSFDTFTHVDGEELETPNESFEIEYLLPEDATPDMLQAAENEILKLADALGIDRERLSPRSNRSLLAAA